MADNYLEKKMDDYRRGNYGYPRLSRLHHQSCRGFELRPAVDSVMVFVSLLSLRNCLIEAFVKAGCRTAFCWHDYREGQLTAQKTGSLSCTVDALSASALDEAVATVVARWGSLGLIVTDVPEALDCQSDIPMIYVGDSPVSCNRCSVVAVAPDERRLHEIASSAVLLATVSSRGKIELF